jgi:3',5'-cyclic AMP phosphodiesterase CpdA
MQLVQISDIHIGSFFKQQVFDNLVDEVNKLMPDGIVITGDLTDDGLLFQLNMLVHKSKGLIALT